MRHFAAAAVLVASTLIAPTIATAAPHEASDRDISAMANMLNDPKMQAGLAGMMVAMTDMLMDVRIDKVREAIGKVHPRAAPGTSDWGDARTLGDVMTRDNPNFHDDVAQNSRMAVGAMGSMASGLAAMMPQLREMAARMGKEVERATRNLPSGQRD